MDATVAIQVRGVSKTFALRAEKTFKERVLRGRTSQPRVESFLSLDNVDATVFRGDTIGLIGHNGSGKSTLLKVIGGIIAPSAGVVQRRGRLAALLELGAGFNQDLTGRENIYLNAAILGLSRTETNRYLESIIDFSEIEDFIDTQVKFYSSGMYVRLAFAIAVHVDPDILLVDEVLAVGDEPFQRKCLSRISEFQAEGRTIVLVSHSADQIASVCNRALVLESGHVLHEGDVGTAIRVLRDAYDTREAMRMKSDRESFEVPAAEVLDVSVENLDRETKDVLAKRGDTFRVRVNARVNRTTEWMCGISFNTPLGHSTYRADTNVMKRPLPTGKGTHCIEFLIPNTNFGAGTLQLNAAVASPLGDVFHKLDCETRLNFEPDVLGQGDLQFDTVVTLKG